MCSYRVDPIRMFLGTTGGKTIPPNIINIYVYIYKYMYMHMHIYIYIYIYI